MPMKLKINSPYVIANLVIMPLIALFTTRFCWHGNDDAYDYVDTYLQQSKVIRLTMPKKYEKKRIYYRFSGGRGPHNSRDYWQLVFYSERFSKYLSIVSFSDIDIKNGPDRDLTRRMGLYNDEPTILAYANTVQWNDAKYGTRECPMPIFVIKATHLRNNREKMEYGHFHGDEKIHIDITRQYVEQYLAHFLAKEEFDRLFKGKKE